MTLQLLVLGWLVPLTALLFDIFIEFMGIALTKTLKKNQTTRAMLTRIGETFLIIIVVGLLWGDVRG